MTTLNGYNKFHACDDLYNIDFTAWLWVEIWMKVQLTSLSYLRIITLIS
jgi:hypothetical protein